MSEMVGWVYPLMLLLLAVGPQIVRSCEVMCVTDESSPAAQNECTRCECTESNTKITCLLPPTFPTAFHPDAVSIEVTGNTENIVYEIVTGTFRNLYNLQNVSLLEMSVRNIEEYAFDNLPNLHRIFIAGSHISHIRSDAFHRLRFTKEKSQIQFTTSLIGELLERSFNDVTFPEEDVTSLIIFTNSDVILMEYNVLHDIHHLSRLVFYRVNIGTMADETFGGINHLTHLVFQHVTVETSTMEIFSSSVDIINLLYDHVDMPYMTGNMLATKTSDMMYLTVTNSVFDTLQCSVWDEDHEPLKTVATDIQVNCDCRINWVIRDDHDIPDELLVEFNCSGPAELAGRTLLELYDQQYDLPCEDLKAVNTCSPSDHLALGWIIAIVVCCVLLLVTVLIIVKVIISRKQKTKAPDPVIEDVTMTISGPYESTTTVTSTAAMHNPVYTRGESGMYAVIDDDVITIKDGSGAVKDSFHYYRSLDSPHVGPDLPKRWTFPLMDQKTHPNKDNVSTDSESSSTTTEEASENSNVDTDKNYTGLQAVTDPQILSAENLMTSSEGYSSLSDSKYSTATGGTPSAYSGLKDLSDNAGAIKSVSDQYSKLQHSSAHDHSVAEQRDANCDYSGLEKNDQPASEEEGYKKLDVTTREEGNKTEKVVTQRADSEETQTPYYLKLV